MKEIKAADIIKTVKELCLKAACDLPGKVEESLYKACMNEVSQFGRFALNTIMENIEYARKLNLPICQDTGMVIVFAEIGQDVHIIEGNLNIAINEGVRQAYKDGYLRKSIVTDPIFKRKNSQDNTPAVIHTEIVPGGSLKIFILPKGGGSENMGRLCMLKPSDGIAGVRGFVIESVLAAGGNACPPTIVGVGIGGTMDLAAVLAKKALCREMGKSNENEEYAELEKSLLEDINRTGVGPQGLGGRNTALAVHIEYFPTHITSMPVAVSFNCHAARSAWAVL